LGSQWNTCGRGIICDPTRWQWARYWWWRSRCILLRQAADTSAARMARPLMLEARAAQRAVRMARLLMLEARAAQRAQRAADRGAGRRGGRVPEAQVRAARVRMRRAQGRRQRRLPLAHEAIVRAQRRQKRRSRQHPRGAKRKAKNRDFSLAFVKK